MATKGEVTEAKVLTAFIERGWAVLVPFAADRAYDLVVSRDDEEFLRVQCKSGREYRDCIVFNTHATDHGRGPRLYHGRADVFAVYSPTQDQVYVLDVAELGRSGWLRLRPTRNNQTRRVRFAADHTIDRWIEGRSPATAVDAQLALVARSAPAR